MFSVNNSGIFNVGTGKATSFEAIGRAVAQRYNVDVHYIKMPDNLKLQYQSYTCADLTKLNSHVNIEWTEVEKYINDYTT